MLEYPGQWGNTSDNFLVLSKCLAYSNPTVLSKSWPLYVTVETSNKGQSFLFDSKSKNGKEGTFEKYLICIIILVKNLKIAMIATQG